MTDAMQSIIDRVRKLLALAEKNPNPHEAAAAMAKAQSLMEEHALSRKTVEAHTGEFERRTVHRGNDLFDMWMAIDTVVGLCFQCRILWFNNAYRQRVLTIVGKPHHVEVGEFIASFLARRFQHELRAHRLRGRKYKAKSYYAGAANGVVERLRQLRKQRQAERPAEMRHALAVIEEADNRELEAHINGTSRTHRREAPVADCGAVVGYLDGRKIEVPIGIASRTEQSSTPRLALANPE